MVCILLWSSAVRVHDSQAYRKKDVTRECVSRILELKYSCQSKLVSALSMLLLPVLSWRVSRAWNPHQFYIWAQVLEACDNLKLLSHATTASPEPSIRAPWREDDAVVGRGNAWWTTAKSGHPCPCQNCSQGASCRKDWKRISTKSSVMSPRRPNRSRDWTELTWTGRHKAYWICTTALPIFENDGCYGILLFLTPVNMCIL